MKRFNRRGFTLIELMIALVVGMLLMASLVALSGSVQRSFGRSKDITDLQGNLRFAMKTLVQDLSRISFMASPDANLDTAHRIGPVPADMGPAVVWSDPILEVRGNYTSSRDYLYNPTIGQVVCRNQEIFNSGAVDPCGGYEDYILPFADGPANLDDIFCPNLMVRLEGDEEKFVYVRTSSVNSGSNNVYLEPFDRNQVRGDYLWINPLTRVQYEVKQAAYTTLYNPHTDAAERWILARRYEGCRAGSLVFDEDMEIGDFLMPQTADQPGMEVEYIEDNNGSLGASLGPPAFNPAVQLVPEAGNTIDAIKVRSMIVTLRGRTETEDPAFVISGYGSTTPDPAQRYGVDLDTFPENGLAHVREERTVIQLRNLGQSTN